MFERCISFTVTYFPKDRTLKVDCLNDRDPYVIYGHDIDVDVQGVSSAIAEAIRQFMDSNEHEDFFEVI